MPVVSKHLKSALAYYTITLRLKVFPLHDVSAGRCSCGDDACGKNAGKHPRVSDWQDIATREFEMVYHRWWAKWPTANIGIPTGQTNGMFVVDVDDQDALENLENLFGPMPETFSYLTGGNGRHLWYLYPKNQKLGNHRGSLLPRGIDIRGDGGYVVVPPSKTLKGEYRFESIGAMGTSEGSSG